MEESREQRRHNDEQFNRLFNAISSIRQDKAFDWRATASIIGAFASIASVGVAVLSIGLGVFAFTQMRFMEMTANPLSERIIALEKHVESEISNSREIRRLQDDNHEKRIQELDDKLQKEDKGWSDTLNANMEHVQGEIDWLKDKVINGHAN